MSTPPDAPPTLTELALTPEMQEAVTGAFAARLPLAIAYVDEHGTPQLSYRGSTQAYSETQLAIWVRNPEGGILAATQHNPAVALIYGKFDPPNERGFMIFRGRARVDDGEAARRKVYESAHEFERNQDPERKGVALVIDLDSVEGFFGGARLKMRR
jgi:hypothetical protein